MNSEPPTQNALAGKSASPSSQRTGITRKRRVRARQIMRDLAFFIHQAKVIKQYRAFMRLHKQLCISEPSGNKSPMAQVIYPHNARISTLHSHRTQTGAQGTHWTKKKHVCTVPKHRKCSQRSVKATIGMLRLNTVPDYWFYLFISVFLPTWWPRYASLWSLTDHLIQSPKPSSEFKTKACQLLVLSTASYHHPQR